MGFPGVVPEHVPGTLGEHGMFPVPCSLLPVPLRIPPSQKKLASGGPAGHLVTGSLFPVPCSHKTPLREHVFRVPCFLGPYGKTHPCFLLLLLRLLLNKHSKIGKKAQPPYHGHKPRASTSQRVSMNLSSVMNSPPGGKGGFVGSR